MLEVNPLPPIGEIPNVVEDIANGREVLVTNGQVKHLVTCGESHETVYLQGLQSALQRLRKQSFRIAVHPGLGRISYQGQPLAIAIEPPINYEVFPDHPHLNTGGFVTFRGQSYYVPDTICYEEDISELGLDPFERFTQTFAYLSVWLLRHMIWVETRNQSYGNGVWIGPEAPPLSLTQRAEAGIFNPSDFCRCGSRKRYADCHMFSDLGVSVFMNISNEEVLKRYISERFQQRREQHRKFYSQRLNSF